MKVTSIIKTIVAAILFTMTSFPLNANSIESNERLLFSYRVQKMDPPKYTLEDYYWLALNVYHEARGQPVDGMIGVITVTLNRTKDERWPSTIKEVVTQKTKGVCQFSWYCEPKLKRGERGNPKFDEIYNFVKETLSRIDSIKDPTHGALFFHSTRIKPSWSVRQRTTARIGDHIFYR